MHNNLGGVVNRKIDYLARLNALLATIEQWGRGEVVIIEDDRLSETRRRQLEERVLSLAMAAMIAEAETLTS